MTQQKACARCQTIKPMDEFSRDAKRPDGRTTWCKVCSAQRRQELATQRLYKRAAKAVFAKEKEPVVEEAPVEPEEAPVEPPKPPKPVKRTTPETDFRPNREVLATFAAIQAIAQDGGVGPNMLWIGPSGSGKTEAARDLARRAKLPFFKIDAPAMTDPEAWFGTREVVVEDGAPKTVYNESQFVVALQQPCVLLIDEGNRVSDAIRNILLALWDDSRQVTNPLTGQPVKRHPECYVVMTANVGLAFTGTYAIDPAFYTRAVTTRFGYLDAKAEAAVAVSRTGCAEDVAELFVRFANETRQRAKTNEDFPPISTREVFTACALVARGLDANSAAHQVMINAAPAEGGAESVQGQLAMIWTGIRKQTT